MIAALALAAALSLDTPPEAGLAPAEAVAPPREIAHGVTFLPGGFLPGRGPDGNTIIFDAPDGLVVVDTGRHVWHSDAILAFARARARPVSAIINTHWHLDHSSGNARLKAAFPHATIFATTAIDRVLASGGFLERGVAETRARLAEPDVPALEREERQIYLDTMEHAQSLRPNVSMQRSGPYNFARRRLDVRITDGAVTDVDLWLYDRHTHVAVLGDLVTLPAPFFETACPQRWRAELDRVWATPFRIAIPGHGEPMTRAQFDAYRTAYNAFIDCVATDIAPAQCASAWTTNIAPFIASDARAQRLAPQMAEYYVTFLRENGNKSPDCRAS